ncbi:baseplate J/gp47 family protein [Modestobacter excelsi]|uniref:baseplate J/gp47 family protein n=1 Tax=Modestobacter excelsi TaxID=2213161 RepID=UPI00110C9428|nr:baseplate J/gp47 family protein [Modestobacter excelsi]
MTLQPLLLDDLEWAPMVEAIRRRVPAESDGTWTLHSPVDPGITLLELFAYLLEQRLYWLDQVPDELVLAVARLLGLPGPRSARAAGTVLRLHAEQAGTAAPLVPDGTVFARDPEQQVAFTVQGPTTVLPVVDDALRLWAGGRERTADLVAHRPVPLFTPDAGPAEVRFVLPLPKAFGRAPRQAQLSLLLQLDVPDRCPAAWLPGSLADVPPPAELVWSWYVPEPDDPAIGTDVAGADAAVDGTAGLRRSGVLRVPLPADWCSGGPDPAPRAYGLRLSTPAATFSTAPVLLQLVPNAVPATHRRRLAVTGKDLVGQLRAWRRLPGQHLDLPAARGTLLSAEVRITRDGTEQPWTVADAFTFAGPAHRVFVADRDAGAVRFGDGLTGAIPVPDLDSAGAALLVEVEYEVGGGTVGNGGLTRNWTVVRDGTPIEPGLVATADNVVPATGGAEAETMPQIRARIGDAQHEVTRAVTPADVVTLVTGTRGVAVARCYVGPGEHPRYPCSTVPGAITVRVVPGVTDPAGRLTDAAYDPRLRPDPGILRAVAARLEPTRLIGTELFVLPPRYRPVALRVELSGAPTDLEAVRAAVRAGLRRFLDPLLGGSEQEGWPFGEPLRPSALLRAAQSALEDLAQVERVAIGLDGAEPEEACFDVPLGSGWLPALTEVRVAPVAGDPGQGLS